MFGAWIDLFVAVCLPLDEEAGCAAAVYSGVFPTTCDDGRRHMVDGRLRGRAFNLISGGRKVASSYCVHEGAEASYFVRFGESSKVGIGRPDVLEEDQPVIPRAIEPGVRTQFNSRFLVLSRASEAIQEIISAGSLVIVICL